MQGAWLGEGQVMAHKTDDLSHQARGHGGGGGGDNRWTLSFALEKQQGTRQAKPLHHLWRGRYGKDLSGDGE